MMRFRFIMSISRNACCCCTQERVWARLEFWAILFGLLFLVWALNNLLVGL
jgi:hypothetical protein